MRSRRSSNSSATDMMWRPDAHHAPDQAEERALLVAELNQAKLWKICRSVPGAVQEGCRPEFGITVERRRREPDVTLKGGLIEGCLSVEARRMESGDESEPRRPKRGTAVKGHGLEPGIALEGGRVEVGVVVKGRPLEPGGAETGVSGGGIPEGVEEGIEKGLREWGAAVVDPRARGEAGQVDVAIGVGHVGKAGAVTREVDTATAVQVLRRDAAAVRPVGRGGRRQKVREESRERARERHIRRTVEQARWLPQRDGGPSAVTRGTHGHLLHPLSAGICVPLFALFAAGVSVSTDALAKVFTTPETLGVIAGLVAGKMLGIFAST